MSKRKISQQQQRRIANKQAELLNQQELSGLVIANYGQNLEIEDSTGHLLVCKKRQNLGPIVPGDRVKWHKIENTDMGVVTMIEPRISLLTRPDQNGVLHAVAANIEQMFIVFAPIPAPNLTTIDRYLLAAEQHQIKPVLVLNKEDLLSDNPLQQQILDLLQIYTNIGVATIVLSAKEHKHLAAVHTMLTAKTSVFVGQSGVGKSSIIATLLPQTQIKTAETTSLHGKHTTTTTRLYHLPELNGSIIDSPGMREFPLWQLEPAKLAHGFIEFRPYLNDCQFRNCKHNNEPGCALLKAASQGKISQSRLSSYQKILAGMEK